ncbi:hypothetical protein OG245_00690 [Streptomyces sp. NBC_01116]|uniref:hypothetical protein n=1 Tax=Streptomyces sp. NBC_01116 TaxID=2903752 RepID=UPI003252223D
MRLRLRLRLRLRHHAPRRRGGYTFYRGDCAWSIVKDSDGRDLGDGSAVYDAHEALSVNLKTAHPQQLADSVLRIITDDQQELAGFPLGLRSVSTGGS